MYFLSDLERKLLIHKLLPAAREVGVSAELRGWSWHDAPLKPFYEDVKLPMYAVCSKFCPTGRDVYLRFVEGIHALLIDESFNTRVKRGFINYIPEDKIIKLEITHAMKVYVRRVLRDIEKIIREERLPPIKVSKKKCAGGCGFKFLCPEQT